ncbi:hypothetical protein [Dactylosporangium salmoneum]|uniref:Uncharacterized protein n=1 Tax=Dactylosporangium salmoneum TaxID=53361 RepID=A0ABN3G9X8_9ACTN
MTTIPALIRALHAAGWRYRVTHEESPRDLDGAPWHDGWYVHRWSRGTAEISVIRLVGGDIEGGVTYNADVEDDGGDGTGGTGHIHVGLGLVKRHGAEILRGLGNCADVFTPVEVLARWRPLELRLPADRWGDWMWMGTVEHDGLRIEQYKHHDTRGYLNLDADGNAWRVVFREKDWDPWCGVPYDSVPDVPPEFTQIPFGAALAAAVH